MSETDCSIYISLFDRFLDGEVSGEERQELAAHLAECPACRAELDNLAALKEELGLLPEPELPDGFHEKLMERLNGYNGRNTVRIRPFKPLDLGRLRLWGRTAAGVAAAFVIISLAFTGGGMIEDMDDPPFGYVFETQCSAGEKSETTDVAQKTSGEALDAAAGEEGFGQAEAAQIAGDGLEPFVRSAPIVQQENNAGTELLDVYDVSDQSAADTYITVVVDDVTEAVEIVRGLAVSISGSTVNVGQSADISLTAAKADYEGVMAAIRSLGGVADESQSNRSVAYEILDARARLNSKLGEYDNIFALYQKPELDIETMLRVEGRASQIDSEISMYGSEIKRLENLAANPRIWLVLEQKQEQVTYEPPSLGERISDSFVASLNAMRSLSEGFIVLVSSAAVPLLIIAAILAVLFLAFKKRGVKRDDGEDKGKTEDK